MQKLGLTPQLWNQNLHLSNTPWWFRITPEFEKHASSTKKKLGRVFLCYVFLSWSILESVGISVCHVQLDSPARVWWIAIVSSPRPCPSSLPEESSSPWPLFSRGLENLSALFYAPRGWLLSSPSSRTLGWLCDVLLSEQQSHILRWLAHSKLGGFYWFELTVLWLPLTTLPRSYIVSSSATNSPKEIYREHRWWQSPR